MDRILTSSTPGLGSASPALWLACPGLSGQFLLCFRSVFNGVGKSKAGVGSGSVFFSLITSWDLAGGDKRVTLAQDQSSVWTLAPPLLVWQPRTDRPLLLPV